MTRVRTEVEMELLRWAERRAARSGRSRDEVLEEAVRRGRDRGRALTEIASEVWQRSDLTGEQAMAIARAETDAVRAARRAADRDVAGA